MISRFTHFLVVRVLSIERRHPHSRDKTFETAGDGMPADTVPAFADLKVS